MKKVILCMVTTLYCLAEAASKKEIFIAGPTERQIGLGEDPVTSTKIWARILVEEKLIDLYAQEHNLPSYKKHKQKAEMLCKQCIEDAIRTDIAYKYTEQQVKKLSSEELKKHYAQLMSGEGGLYVIHRFSFPIVKGSLPPFSESILENIREVLYNTWLKANKSAISDNDIKERKNDPKYKKNIEECERVNYLASPGALAFYDDMTVSLKNQVQSMSQEELEKIYQQHKDKYNMPPFNREQVLGMLTDEQKEKTLHSFIKNYTITSDSEAILSAAKEL